MVIKICIGSSCHMQGVIAVIERLQEYIESEELTDEVELTGCMCSGQCSRGVRVWVDDEQYTVTPQNVDEFILDRIGSRVSRLPRSSGE